MDLWATLKRRIGAIRAALGFTPTRRLALALALAAPLFLLSGWPVGLWLARLVLLCIVAALVVDVAMLPRRSDIDVVREFPDTVGVGDHVSGRYLVTSHRDQPLWATLFDDLPAKHLAGTDRFAESLLAPKGTLEHSFDVTGADRGETALGDLAVRIRTKLGLASRSFRYAQSDRVLVAPSLAGVKRFRWLAVHHRLATVGVRDARRRGEGRAFARLRDYVVGDDPRHIDWKATARRGHPITREFTVEQSQTVFILVDAGRSMTQLAGRYPRFEYALSAALLLADVAITAGDRVGALVFDDQLRALVPAQRGVTALAALRTALVPVQATLVEPDYAAAFRVLAQRQRKRSLIVLITDVIDARASRSLLAHLTRGASRHLAVVVALRNDALLQAATIRGDLSRDMYESAAAEELIAERLTSLQRMRDAGVVVLDVAPDAMAAAVVNQYLELKTRGAL
ncbi:MAG: hypothetical protein JWL61_849 [Gemmatimonadetes bacterium]|nr:hypothetical protein [Gemmatimonadota bacterium]